MNVTVALHVSAVMLAGAIITTLHYHALAVEPVSLLADPVAGLLLCMLCDVSVFLLPATCLLSASALLPHSTDSYVQ